MDPSANSPIATALSDEERRQLRLQRAREAGVMHNLNVAQARLAAAAAATKEPEPEPAAATYSPMWGIAGYAFGLLSAVILYKVGHHLLWKLTGKAAEEAMIETAQVIDQAVAASNPMTSNTALSAAAQEFLRRSNITLPSVQ